VFDRETCNPQERRLRILVAIANFGSGNRDFLDRLLDEYRQMRFDLDIVVLSNVPKDLGPNIEVVVGLPTKNPRSLPFAHRPLFADRIHQYDLFIYSEDDTLITERNIEAFLDANATLMDDEIAGFLRQEASEDGRVFISTVHSHFHWDVRSLRSRGGRTYARFTNEHSACFILTRSQLRRAIDSGGFLVPPHEGRYAMLETAATDPYTQCGFVKLLCVSHPQEFIVRHLPNKYIGRMGIEVSEFHRQLERLREIGSDGFAGTELLTAESKLPGMPWSKNYFEPCRRELLATIPAEVQTALSLGCGWGETERVLSERGVQVVGLALDPVIAVSAKLRGVETVCGGFSEARAALRDRRFDCVLALNILHLVPDPVGLLRLFVELMSKDGICVLTVPNFMRLPMLWKRARRLGGYQHIGDFDRSGLQMTTARRLRTWLARSGLRVERVDWLVPQRFERYRALTFGLVDELLASDLVVFARRQSCH